MFFLQNFLFTSQFEKSLLALLQTNNGITTQLNDFFFSEIALNYICLNSEFHYKNSLCIIVNTCIQDD